MQAGADALTVEESSPKTLLYVTSYAGTLSTLALTSSGTEAKLQVLATYSCCGPSSTWLTLDRPKSVLYCLDEGVEGPNGGLASYEVQADGRLVQLDKVLTPGGPVSSVIYGHGGSGLALAFYAGAGFSSYSITDPGAIAEIQSETYKLERPGPDSARQEAPHPHQAILDPTGRFIVVPDLGADLVRVYAVDNTNLRCTPLAPLSVAPGSGPRHVTFLASKDKVFMYLVTELTNLIIGYEVIYDKNHNVSFREVYQSGTHGKDKPAPKGAYASEILVSPDSKFIVVSSRNESSFSIPAFGSNDGSEIPSDVLISFAIDHATGSLQLVQEYPSGGIFPRHFSFNEAGTLVAVANQFDDRVVIIDRDVVSGKLGGIIAYAEIPGPPTCVIFNE